MQTSPRSVAIGGRNATYAPVAAVDSKVDKVASNVRLYGTDGLGSQTTVGYGTPPNASTVAFRTSGGRLKVGAPTESDDATTKAYVDAQSGGGGGTSAVGEVSVASAPILASYGAPITVTPTAVSTTSITDGVLVERADAALRYEGLTNRGDTGSHYYFQRLTGSTAGTASNPWLVAFDYDCQEFEIKAWTAGSPRVEYRLWSMVSPWRRSSPSSARRCVGDQGSVPDGAVAAHRARGRLGFQLRWHLARAGRDSAPVVHFRQHRRNLPCSETLWCGARASPPPVSRHSGSCRNSAGSWAGPSRTSVSAVPAGPPM